MFKKRLILFCLGIMPNVISAQIRNIPDCGIISSFVNKQNFDNRATAYSTSELQQIGLTFVDNSTNPKKVFQHPSWRGAGHLAALAIDGSGVVYTAPMPQISVLQNPIEDQNTIYRVDPVTGEMKSWIKLPSEQFFRRNENPFGILGLYLDCSSHILWVSSIYGSTIHAEKGKITAIQIEGGKGVILGSLENVDVIGLCIALLNNEKRLFFGKARTSDIFSVQVDEEGKIKGMPRFEVSLENLGARGDDRARRIRFNAQGLMEVWGVTFQYNLSAPHQKQETQYTFRYDADYQKWHLVAIQ